VNNKTVIISGGSRGIGRAIALRLGKEGFNISFNYRESADSAATLESEISSSGGKAVGYQADIRNFEAVRQWVKDTQERFGSIDIVINNAGVIADKALALMDESDWRGVIDANLCGVFNLTRAAIVPMVKQKSGNVVNITSVTGITGMPRQTNYAATKAGIIGFTKSLAKEVAKYHIRVNAVAPGFIETDMIGGLKDSYKQEMLEKIPQGRFGKPEDVAGAARFLISEEARYITGQTIVIDGGMTMAN
jgi:3-oxoacyl-[acyl-carrier protein] reductase